MQNIAPSAQEWKMLYEAAKDFRNLKPWGWMSERDIFGVQDPEGGKVGYCCIMGELGEVFALAVYLGTDGLNGYLQIQAGEFDIEGPDVMFIQKCLMASFEDRRDLENEDLKTLKGLDLRFRGRKAWPQFRSFVPGYAPWHLTGEQVRFLTIALRQAVYVAARFRLNKNLLRPPDDDLFFVRVSKKEGHKMVWCDEWMEPYEHENSALRSVVVDELRIKRIEKRMTGRGGVWEIDSFYFPGVVEEGERPYFPRISLIADAQSGLVLYFWVNPPWEYPFDFDKSILSFFEESKLLPNGIFVSKEEIYHALEPITSRLHIDLEIVDILSAVEELRDDMLGRLSDIREGDTFNFQ